MGAPEQPSGGMTQHIDPSDLWWQEDEGVWVYWPMCTIDGCPNRICLALGETELCFPHAANRPRSVSDLIQDLTTTEPTD